MEREIKEYMPLLGENAHITKEGWARRPYWIYRRLDAACSRMRIKEWDYYQITDTENRWSVNLTYSDLGLFSLVSVSYIDYEKKDFAQNNVIKLFSLHKGGLGASPEDEYRVTMADKSMTLTFINRRDKKNILATCPELKLPDGRTGLKVDFTLARPEESESINIATSWKEDRNRFYYNQKNGTFRVKGEIIRGKDIEEVNEEKTLALLDWGRGYWAKESTWYWGAIQGHDTDGTPYDINVGYGFTDRTPASENGIIYEDKVHKLDLVEFTLPSGDLTSDEWKVKDNEGRLELTMEPLVNRKDHTDLKVIISLQDQVFGHFRGFFITDDGKRVDVDTIGFLERVYNKW